MPLLRQLVVEYSDLPVSSADRPQVASINPPAHTSDAVAKDVRDVNSSAIYRAYTVSGFEIHDYPAANGTVHTRVLRMLSTPSFHR